MWVSSLPKLLGEIKGNKFSRDTVFLLIAQSVLIGSGFFINYLIGLKLGADDLGVFSQALAFFMLYATIFSLGINNAVIKHTSELCQEERHKEKSVVTIGLLFSFFSTLLLSAVILAIPAFLFSFYSSERVEIAVGITVLALPFYNVNRVLMSYYSGRQNQRMFSIIRSLRWLILFIAITAFIYLEADICSVLYSFLITEGVLTIFFGYRLIPLLTRRITLGEMKTQFRFGVKSFAAELISLLYDKFDILLLGYFLLEGDLGVYSFLIFFVKAIYLFPSVLSQNVSPIISNLWFHKNVEALRQKVREVRKLNLKIVAFKLVVLLVGYWVVLLFNAEEFADSYLYFLVALSGSVAFAYIYWSGSFLIMTGFLKENIYRVIIILTSSLILTVVLTERFGLMGACVACSTNALLAFLINSAYIKRLTGIAIY